MINFQKLSCLSDYSFPQDTTPTKNHGPR